MAKNFQKSVLGLALGNMFLMVSLKAKLKACVGKYRITLARFPRQKDSTPCSADTRVKQFPIPAQVMCIDFDVFNEAASQSQYCVMAEGSTPCAGCYSSK